MRVGVAREAPGETRVAMTPKVAQRLVADGHTVTIESGLAEHLGMSDAEFRDAGAVPTAQPYDGADLVLVVGPPTAALVETMGEGTALAGFLDPFAAGELVAALVERRITSFAMEAIPRTTLAQGMDALSSQASVAGYHAVLLAATETPRVFPMLITAAGTIPPVKLLVLGAGVAGLQAIATARRLGAVVSAYDIRPQVKEQIESLGAKFIAAPTDESAASASGYATEVADETQRRQQRALAPFVAEADVVVTTAQIPGRPAPLLVSREMVEQMRPGSVVVDVAASTGGNCELTRGGETVEHRGVKVLGPTDLAGRVGVDASEMYARNLSAFIARLVDDAGGFSFDPDDEIAGGACITCDGHVTHPVTRRALGLDTEGEQP